MPDRLVTVVSEVVDELLGRSDVITPLDVLLALEIVDTDHVEAWRHGRVPYLERGITKGLSRVTRLLRLLREAALARGLAPVPGKYVRRGKGPKRRLRFSKRGDLESERAYATHFVRAAAIAPAREEH